MIDLISKDQDGRVVLYAIASGEWFDAGRSLSTLEAKLETYLRYVSGGQLDEADSAGARAPVVVRLRYPDPPDAALREVIDRFAARAGAAGVTAEIEVAPELRA